VSLFFSQVASANCLDGFRSAFQPRSILDGKITKAIDALLNRKGRAQARNIERILAERRAKAEANGESWDAHVEKWENEILDRMSDGKKGSHPDLDELLAVMAAKSPTFQLQLGELLTQHGAIRFRVLAHFLEDVQTLGKEPWAKGGKVTEGRRFWELWQRTIRLPARRAWTREELSTFMTEISSVMFKVMNPEPGFRRMWIKSFFDESIDPAQWKVWRRFSERFLERYRWRYKRMLEGVQAEAEGQPRPEVIRDFYRWGIRDAIWRRLAKLSGAKEQAEIERLSFELMYFVRPVISGFFLYEGIVLPVQGYLDFKRQSEKMADDVRDHPEKYLGDYEKADDDRLKNFEEQIAYLTQEKRDLEAELAGGGLSSDERAMRQRTLNAVNRRISKIQELKVEVMRGITPGG
jgi:hypothetical protein